MLFRSVTGTKALAVTLAIAFTAGLYLFLYRTRLGKSVRAVANPLQAALNIEVDIQRALDDPKVDVLVIDPETPLQPIHRVARETGVRL